ALVGLAKPIFDGLKNVGGGNISVVPLDPYFGLTSSQNFLETAIGANSFVGWVSYAFVIGFAINILMVLLKRWTNCHSIMITGHVMIQQSAIITSIIYFILFRKIPLIDGNPQAGEQVGTFLLSGLFLGTYWSVGSNVTIKPTEKVTDNAGFAIGHQQMLGIGLVSKISRFFGNEKDSAENRKLSKKFKIFEDNIFTQTAIILFLFFILIMILQYATPAGFDPSAKDSPFASWNVAPGAFWLTNWFLGSLKLVASVLAIITGVRMFVTELQQSFQGISEKIIPGAVVAVDAAASYGFSPNSVTYGFVSGTIAQFIALGIIVGISSAGVSVVIAIPLFITLFFNSGTMGVYANAYGGWKASLIVPAILGFFEIIIISFSLSLINNSASTGDLGLVKPESPYETGYMGMIDFTLFLGTLLLLTGSSAIGGWIAFPVAIVAMILIAQITDTSKRSNQTLLQKMLGLKITKKEIVK
ncbi:MAG: PTS ascorbate transporter subunit IIC, partial [Mycoplasmataceae bacterium]|nr:PTS ascorbate transporter subunit IIC [Mycoplasmataceae bacterium]